MYKLIILVLSAVLLSSCMQQYDIILKNSPGEQYISIGDAVSRTNITVGFTLGGYRGKIPAVINVNDTSFDYDANSTNEAQFVSFSNIRVSLTIGGEKAAFSSWKTGDGYTYDGYYVNEGTAVHAYHQLLSPELNESGSYRIQADLYLSNILIWAIDESVEVEFGSLNNFMNY